MEEQMIQDFVHRVSRDEELRKELASDPNAVLFAARCPHHRPPRADVSVGPVIGAIALLVALTIET